MTIEYNAESSESTSTCNLVIVESGNPNPKLP